jgi:hypothetical protein
MPMNRIEEIAHRHAASAAEQIVNCYDLDEPRAVVFGRILFRISKAVESALAEIEGGEESLIQLTHGLARRLYSTVEHAVPECDRERVLARFREVTASDVRRYEARKGVRR